MQPFQPSRGFFDREILWRPCRLLRNLFLLICLGSAIWPAHARNEPTNSDLEPNEARIPQGQLATWDFRPPTVAPGNVLAIAFKARAWGNPAYHAGGSLFAMDIRINGRPLAAQDDRLTIRLRNRPTVSSAGVVHTHRAGWRIITAPSFGEPSHGSETTDFVVEVSQLLKPGENRLVISTHNLIGSDTAIFIRDLRLVFIPDLHRPAGFKIQASVARLTSRPNGALVITGDGIDLPLSSFFSVPGGGWERLGPPTALRSGEAQAFVTTSLSGNMVLRSKAYRVERNVTIDRGRALVRDQIVNESSVDLGMMVRYEIALPGRIPVVRLAGNDEPAQLQLIAPYNPTVFAPLGAISLGLVAEDDVLREQAILYYDEDVARPNGSPHLGLRTERLAIPAGESVTIQWSLYALPLADYFDFVNRIRSDWGVKLTLNGPYWWNILRSMELSDETLANWLHSRRVYAAVVGSWVRPDDKRAARLQALGASVMGPSFGDYRDLVRNSITRIKRISPSLKIGIYNHFFFDAPPTENSYKDSRILTAKGIPYVETFGGRYSPAVGVYPTETNSFGKALRIALQKQADTLGVDGFYFDESNRSGSVHDPITYSVWDRRSAILDPRTFAILQRIGYIPLLSANYQARLYADLRRRGFWILGNDQPYRMVENRDTWPRFSETDVLTDIYRSNLYSPLAFSYKFEHYTVQDLRDRLDLGGILAMTGPADTLGIVEKFFPITPLELHRGWIQGEERIITDRSGEFGWRDRPSRVRVWQYTAKGDPTETDPPWRDLDRPVSITVPEGGLVIIERKGP